MAIKKNEIYTSLYASCDKLRGGMDPSQYKNYILTLLFVKYVSDKFKGVKYAEIEIPEGGSWDDILALRGTKNIGEGIDIVIAKLAEANELQGIIDNAHFNDDTKLGSGQTMVDKLTDLVNIFNRPEFDFRNNKAGGDDILGDAYEYLMRRFAVESGKSKGQFYTPAEVSRILAKVVGIDEIRPRAEGYTVYDPACGSGSLLIRAVNEAPFDIALYGQELDETTAGLAKMNLVLHNRAAGEIKGNKSTFSEPQYFEEGSGDQVLRRFDFVVMNPPFSTKNWTDGYKDFGRCEGFGAMPPEKNGDFAWFLHVIKSLKSTGKAAIIMPHGVLFRGNAEETIRRTIIDRGLIKAIISLPTNMFYGTGIPASVIVIDKEDADERAGSAEAYQGLSEEAIQRVINEEIASGTKGIFMIDASHGFIKDGNKNRLREEDIYRIITTFKRRIVSDPHYARFVPNYEIKVKNGYNLNISRYIESGEREDIQDIDGHLNGGIPVADVESLSKFWTLFPKLKEKLFQPVREGYFGIQVDVDEVRNVVYNDEDFSAYADRIAEAFAFWKAKVDAQLRSISEETDIKVLIAEIAEVLVTEFEPIELISKYDVYEALLSYWNETMADDAFVIKYDGYEAGRETNDIVEVTKGKDGKEKEKVKGWEGKLIPQSLMERVYFSAERDAISALQFEFDDAQASLDEWIEEQSGEDGLLSTDDGDGGEDEDSVKVNAKYLAERIAELQSHTVTDETLALEEFLEAFLAQGMKKKDYLSYISTHLLCAGAINDKGSVSKTTIAKRIKEIRATTPVREEYADDFAELTKAYEWAKRIDTLSKDIKEKSTDLDKAVREKYAALTDEELKDLLINQKWYVCIWEGVNALYKSAAHSLASRVSELGERYEYTLSELETKTDSLEETVKAHLERMGFVW